jgi:hypothetical protein
MAQCSGAGSVTSGREASVVVVGQGDGVARVGCHYEVFAKEVVGIFIRKSRVGPEVAFRNGPRRDLTRGVGSDQHRGECVGASDANEILAWRTFRAAASAEGWLLE